MPDTGANSGWLNTHLATGALDQFGANVRFDAPRREGVCDVTATYQSNLLRLYNADINIPPDATIKGIKLRVHARTEGLRPRLRTLHFWGARANTSPLITDSVPSDDLLLTTPWQTHEFGHGTYRWGVGDALTTAIVTHQWFGIRIGFDIELMCNGSDSNALVDGAEIKVYYERCR